MSTPQEIIDALIQQSETRTKISLIRDWYPEIERALKSGVRYAAINKVLAQHGIRLTEAHLRQAVYTLRNQTRVTSAKLMKPAPVHAASSTPTNLPLDPSGSGARVIVPAPLTAPFASPAPKPVRSHAQSTPATSVITQPTLEQLSAMLPPCPRNGQVEIDHPLPDNLPPGVNIKLLQRVMKMDGFNPDWLKDFRLDLIRALPDILPDHLNPIAEIGGVRCDFRLGIPSVFGSTSDGMGVKRGDDRWDKILRDEKLRRQWRRAHEAMRNDYNDWLKELIGLPIS